MSNDDMVVGQSDSEEEVTAESTETTKETDVPQEQETAEVEAEAVEEIAEESSEETVANGNSVVETSLSDADLFLAALNGELADDEEFGLTSLHRGQIVQGEIASINDSEILVDVGAKSEGIIAGRELESLDRDTIDELNVGDSIDVYVINPENRDGHILLSLRRAIEEQDWQKAEEYKNEDKAYQSTIAGYNKGGLIVRFGKVRGFVPSSQVSRDRRMRSTGNTPDERWGKMVGEELIVKVIEVDRGRNRLILSERAAEREQRAEMRAKLFETLEVGQVFEGRVTRLADFGAFVDIGGMDGLVHISEMAWKPINHPRDVLRAGDQIEVEVIHIDEERQRVGLSRKNRLADPWDELAQEYTVDQLVQGVVTKLTKFGAFARLVDHPEIEGLIHISELADRRVGHPREVVEEGQVLTLRIIRIDPERRRMGLSLKRIDSPEYMADDWQDILEEMNEDDSEEKAVAEVEDTIEAESEEVSVEVEEALEESTEDVAVEAEEAIAEAEEETTAGVEETLEEAEETVEAVTVEVEEVEIETEEAASES